MKTMQELMESIIAMEAECCGPIVTHHGKQKQVTGFNEKTNKVKLIDKENIGAEDEEVDIKDIDADDKSMEEIKAMMEATDYANEPDEVYYDPTEITHTGDDLHRSKKSHIKASDGDNPRPLDESLDVFRTKFREALSEEFGDDVIAEEKYTLKKSKENLDGWEVFEKDPKNSGEEYSSDFFDNEADAKKELKSRSKKGSFGIRKVTDKGDCWCVMKGNEKIASYHSKEDAQEHIDSLTESIETINAINKLLTEGSLGNDLFQLAWHLIYKLGNLIPSIKADRQRAEYIQRELRLSIASYDKLKNQIGELDLDSTLEKLKKSFKATNKSSLQKRDREMAEITERFQKLNELLDKINDPTFPDKTPEEKIAYVRKIIVDKSKLINQLNGLRGYIRRRNTQVDVANTKKFNRKQNKR